MLVAVLADTHAPARCKALPTGVLRHIVDADVVLHAGDVCTTALLEEIASLAPVHVAMGNCDAADVQRWGALEEVLLDLDGVRVAMTHDAGPRDGRARRMRRRFPGADVVVFGHSHLPLVERAEGVLLLNPGSPTDRRRAPAHTMALLRVESGRAEAELVQFD